jgi:hypothetical protein
MQKEIIIEEKVILSYRIKYGHIFSVKRAAAGEMVQGFQMPNASIYRAVDWQQRIQRIKAKCPELGDVTAKLVKED